MAARLALPACLGAAGRLVGGKGPAATSDSGHGGPESDHVLRAPGHQTQLHGVAEVVVVGDDADSEAVASGPLAGEAARVVVLTGPVLRTGQREGDDGGGDDL